MSEKLTAENIVKEMPHHAINGSIEGNAWLIAQIKCAEQAARDEGYTQGCADTIHNSPMFEDQSKMLKIETDAAFKYGLERGQREMRERAASVGFGRCDCVNAGFTHMDFDKCSAVIKIRAIPIDSGEGKS